ncbi:MAG TPA: helix-turn-helix domain-containing protein [Solirubrobacterales bacterium]|nr:helix-turn-helix domain-containing protein [Solirubrobacterales bacterium]
MPSDRPWTGIPPRIGELLRPHLPALADEVIEAIREGVPAYRRPLRGRFGAGIRTGVEEALGQFADLISDPDLDRSGGERVYRGLGRGEYRERRSLDALLAAYRLGARVSWRRIAEIAIDAHVDRRTLALLAEAVFAYIDELTALSAEGYAEEQSVAAGETQRRRRRVAELLLDPDPDEDSVRDAAADAGWTLPAEIAALVWADGGRRVRARLPEAALVVEDEITGGGTALVADPEAPALRARLERAATGTLATLGPTVPLLAAATSAARATSLLTLIGDGSVEGSGLAACAEHLASLATHGDPTVLRELAESRLAPLESETPASRERLTATLRAWLDHQGEVSRVAAELHVHPQTVRYRLGRLRELFGEALETPSGRFELALALRGPVSRPT